jgi:hypothetical protein
MAFLSAYPLSNRLGNGTTDDLLGIRKKAVCVGWADWYEADPKNPYLPAGHDQGRFLERLI